jgi:protein subunit release factor A
MFEKLEGVALRYEDISQELMSPDVASDQKHFRELMKEQSDLAPWPRRNCPLRARNSPNWRNASEYFFFPKILMMTRM